MCLSGRRLQVGPVAALERDKQERGRSRLWGGRSRPASVGDTRNLVKRTVRSAMVNVGTALDVPPALQSGGRSGQIFVPVNV